MGKKITGEEGRWTSEMFKPIVSIPFEPIASTPREEDLVFLRELVTTTCL